MAGEARRYTVVGLLPVFVVSMLSGLLLTSGASEPVRLVALIVATWGMWSLTLTDRALRPLDRVHRTLRHAPCAVAFISDLLRLAALAATAWRAASLPPPGRSPGLWRALFIGPPPERLHHRATTAPIVRTGPPAATWATLPQVLPAAA